MNTITIENVTFGEGCKTFIIAEGCDNPVSYTHLDVYKRQIQIYVG